MRDNPELFQPDYGITPEMRRYDTASRVDKFRGEIEDLQALIRRFSGPEATLIRWILGNKVSQTQNRLGAYLAGRRDVDAMRYEWQLREEGRGGEADALKSARMGGTTGIAAIPSIAGEFTPPPIPDWMQKYIDPSVPLKRSPLEEKGVGPSLQAFGYKRPGALRPFGAQEELTPEEMLFMAGYQAWGKAGAPTGMGGLTEMADWQKHWQPHVALSQKLFPKQAKLGKRWSVASQR